MGSYKDSIINNMYDFYDYSNKSVMIVGAGYGKLNGYANNANRIIAVDKDKEALSMLEKALEKDTMNSKYSLINDEMEKVNLNVDCVVFEFVLHQIDDIERAIDHAMRISKNVIMVNHKSNSEWINLVNEQDNAKRVEKVLQKYSIKRYIDYCSYILMSSYDKMVSQLQNGLIIEKNDPIKRYENRKDISIEMRYQIAEIEY